MGQPSFGVVVDIASDLDDSANLEWNIEVEHRVMVRESVSELADALERTGDLLPASGGIGKRAVQTVTPQLLVFDAQ
ncbi:hypothetical protein ACIA8C_32080 [Nocardia sp. NPDC051321]|uniref:hypothetical protein n=1 Tax=Nocardia sp. NPDC051321 TaxID=3364323 RepID=UPI0037A18644